MNAQSAEQRAWNRRFAAAYVWALGLREADAITLEAEVVEKLDAGELLNDAAIVNRARRMQFDEDLRAIGLTQEQIDALRFQLYGTFAYDTYRGQISRLLELVGSGDESARLRLREQLDAASADREVSPEQVGRLKKFVNDALGGTQPTS